jgi:hypothetical protein
MTGTDSRSAGLTRVTVNLTPRGFAAMELAGGLTGDSKTDTVNRALQVYAYFEHIVRGGGAVYVREADGGDLERVQIL